MPDLVVFPDTDTLARKILRQELPGRGFAGIKIGTELPAEMPPRFIKCFTLPGREISRRTQWCQAIVQVYDVPGEEPRCSQLARLCGAILRAAPEIVVDGEQHISEPCELHNAFFTEDPDLPGIPRCQVTVTWTVQSTVTS